MPLHTCRRQGEQGIYEDMTATAAFRMALPSQLSHPAGRVPVRVRVSRRARRLALKIDAVGDAVELVLPPRTSVPRALNFLKIFNVATSCSIGHIHRIRSQRQLENRAISG